jgi:acyl carrier protein
MMSEEELKQIILAALGEAVPGSDVDEVDAGVSFRDQIEIDSIDFLTFVLILEKKLGLKVPEIDYPKLSSLSGCLTYFESGRGTAAEAAEQGGTGA